MRGRPVAQQDYDDVRRLHAAGLGRNAIQAETGRSGRTVSRIAKELGLSFERGEQVKAATEAKKTDAAARRARLQVDMLEAAEKLLGQMFAPTVVFNFGGSENIYREKTRLEPPFKDKREIASALTQLVNGSTRLAELDKGTGIDQAKSMLGALAAGLGAAYEQLQTSEAEDADRP